MQAVSGPQQLQSIATPQPGVPQEWKPLFSVKISKKVQPLSRWLRRLRSLLGSDAEMRMGSRGKNRKRKCIASFDS